MSKEITFEVGDIITSMLGPRLPHEVTAIDRFSGDLFVQPIDGDNEGAGLTWWPGRRMERALANGLLTIQKKGEKNVILKGVLTARLKPEKRPKRCVESNFVLPRHREEKISTIEYYSYMDRLDRTLEKALAAKSRYIDKIKRKPGRTNAK
jgi:hypothetical protein